MSADAADGRPAYQRLADELRKAIAAGVYRPGDQLPTMGELAESHGIAVMTVREAIKTLVGEQLVVTRQGKGVFVLRVPEPSELQVSGADVIMALRQLEGVVDQLAERLAAVEERLDHPGDAPPRPAG